MKTNVNTDPRDYVAEVSEFTGKTSMKRFLLGLFSLRRMRFDPSTLSSQPSTAADISPSSSRLAKSFGVVIPTFFLKAHRRRRRKLGADGAARKLARRGGLPRSFVVTVSSATRNVKGATVPAAPCWRESTERFDSCLLAAAIRMHVRVISYCVYNRLSSE
jgi:hypothetical protein